MNKKSLIPIALSIAVMFTACSKLASPADTIRPPQNVSNTQGVNIIDEFNQMKSKSSTPGELMRYIEPKIGNLSKADADSVVKSLLEVQKKLLVNYSLKIMKEGFNEKINSYKFEDLTALKNIKDEDIKVFLENVFNDGYKLARSEGLYYIEIDFAAMQSKFSPFVSEETRGYLDIMAQECSKHFSEDAAIIISLEQLAERIVRAERFIDKYKDSKFAEEVSALNKNYLYAYLLGLNNTPAFGYEDNLLKFEVRESYKDTISRYPDSKLAGILKDYTALLDKNNNKRTQEILNFVNKAAAK